jgi:hypothetical protein
VNSVFPRFFKLQKLYSDGKIFPSNLDAREFFLDSRRRQRAGEMPMFNHVVMNLPAIALEFLGIIVVFLFSHFSVSPQMFFVMLMPRMRSVRGFMYTVLQVLMITNQTFYRYFLLT